MKTNLDTASVTDIQFFKHVQPTYDDDVITYSANVIINDTVMIQLSGGHSSSDSCDVYVPESREVIWKEGTDEAQDWLSENITSEELDKFLNDNEIENNFLFLEENGILEN